MKILHISTFDGSVGAGRAAYRLHKGLHHLGCESSMLVAWRSSNDPMVTALVHSRNVVARLRRRLRREQISRNFARYQKSRPAGCEYFSDDRSPWGLDLLNQLPSCDVINLHWVAEFVDYQNFFKTVPEHIPIIWRLADMNPFTGGCHYNDGCQQYIERCGGCPQLGSKDSNDLSGKIWQRKQITFSHIKPGKLHIVALSRWMADQIRRSTLLGNFPITIIPNGLDTETFTPRDRDFSRDILGIPTEAKVVLFVAAWLKNRRKGFALLVQAMKGLDTVVPNLFLLSVGSGQEIIDPEISCLHLGRMNDDRFLSLAYSAADLFVIPSLEDNFPNTVLESMACGTPVVGFNVGGIPDMVRSDVTGLLVSVGDVKALRAAIVELLQNSSLQATMSANCRYVAVNEYTLEIQARRYIELYEAMLNEMPNLNPTPSTAT